LPENRLLLLPQGAAARRREHESLLQLLLACGADLQRVFEASGETIEQFALHLSKASVLPTNSEPLVVLTKTSPLALSVIQTRKILEGLLPPLRTAAWVIFYDPFDDPFFAVEVGKRGVLDDEINRAPIWSTYGEGEYLVLVPESRHQGSLRVRVFELLKRASGMSRISSRFSW
jgi:hypothetical protein